MNTFLMPVEIVDGSEALTVAFTTGNFTYPWFVMLEHMLSRSISAPHTAEDGTTPTYGLNGI